VTDKKIRFPRLSRSAKVDAVSTTPRRAASSPRRPWGTLLRVIGLSLAVVLVSSAAIGGIAVWKITQSIDSVQLQGETGTDEEVKLAAIGEMKGAFNVLIVGTDTRDGQRAMFGDVSSALNDVNIIVHVSKDHTRATAVSIPRDMVVPLPPCPRPDGSSSGAASGLPINTALSYGGLNCVALTVENLTGLKIKYAGLVTFGGVAALSTAIGGVQVCIDAPIHDSYTGLNLPKAGKYVLEGYRALAFLRSRHGVGDGSDLGRISSQQVYLSSLVRKIQDENVLLDPTKVYGLASTAAKSMTLSRSLSSLDTMVAMALVLKDIPRENIIFAQYPGTTGVGGIYTGKVAPLTDIANQLFSLIRKDKPFRLATDSTGPGSTLKGKTTAKTKGVLLPGVHGQTAAQNTCSVSYHF
jgi:LCP family protein required for cell wall assembly